MRLLLCLTSLGPTWVLHMGEEASNSEASNSEASNLEASNSEASNSEASNSEASNSESCIVTDFQRRELSSDR